MKLIVAAPRVVTRTQSQNILMEMLDNHDPLEKKYAMANCYTFLTKSLWRMIMNKFRFTHFYVEIQRL